VRGADGDEYAGFANFQPSEAVHDGYTADGKFLVFNWAPISRILLSAMGS
jgi:hypothetical protein